MMRPQAVVFDLGKVLVDFDYRRAVRNLLPHCTVTAEELIRILNQSDLLHRYETGWLTTAQFFAEVKAASGYRGDLGEFRELFADIFTPIDPMIELHARLRERGLLTYIFSNTNDLAVRYIRKHFPFFSNFDGYLLSFEHGAMKPEEKFYRVVEERVGATGEALVYIDDRPENIAVGLARHWRSILHESPEQTRAAVQMLGLI